MASFNGQKWSSRDFFSRREFFSRVENLFFESRIFFFRVENFFMESRIFSWSRESCHRDDNFYLASRLFLSSRELFLRVEFWQPVEIFFLESRFVCRVENFFIESRIPNMPCRQLPPKWSNNMAVCRSVAYVAFLFIVVVLQVADGNVEELERFHVHTGFYFPYRTMHSSRRWQKYGIHIRFGLCWKTLWK